MARDRRHPPPPEYIIESYLVVLQAEHENDKGKVPQYLERFKKLKGDYDERHAYWQKELPEGEIKQLLLVSSYQPAQAFYATAIDEFFPALQEGDAPRRAAALEKLSVEYEAHRQQIDRLVTKTNAKDSQIEAETASVLRSSATFMVLLCLLVLGGCLALSSVIIRSITGTFKICTAITDSIASGDLLVQVPIAGRGSVRDMLCSLRIMVDKFQGVVRQIENTSMQLVQSSTHLSQASEQIAGNADNAASETTTVATVGEQMAATSHEISASCHAAAQNSQNTSSIAASGVEVVASTISVMQQIADLVQDTARSSHQCAVQAAQLSACAQDLERILQQFKLG